MITKIIRSPKGTARQEVDLTNIEIPDAYHLAMRLKKEGRVKEGEMVYDLWCLTHDLMGNILADVTGTKL
jgi:hypothetical protein